ncbi:hypothetical protein BIZ37_22035 [Photobacterium sp. BZF1]|uniref:hypothetical protein n=1 Tax=Photobacterium sp. BZF1 TaxID=1904457 RepID=UPI001653A64D|nr:hypothetical protein [Photobacterium sp. BZF1]MBC7005251.1 hypothetical protein [Photobacterium sp. BZF1]
MNIKLVGLFAAFALAVASSGAHAYSYKSYYKHDYKSYHKADYKKPVIKYKKTKYKPQKPQKCKPTKSYYGSKKKVRFSKCDRHYGY